jgi:hypothetical protein
VTEQVKRVTVLREFCEVPVPFPVEYYAAGLVAAKRKVESNSTCTPREQSRSGPGIIRSHPYPSLSTVKLTGKEQTLGSAFQIERQCNYHGATLEDIIKKNLKIAKAVPLHAMKALGGRGGIAPTQS